MYALSNLHWNLKLLLHSTTSKIMVDYKMELELEET
jgi:hypothetical protein